MKARIQLLENLLSFLLPPLYLALILTFDVSASYQTVSPPLLTIGLLFASLLLKPRWMIFWAAVYSITVVIILLDPRMYAIFSDGNYPLETTSHMFRTLGFIVTSLFACVFSWMLARLQKKREALHHLIRQMPLPVIISDLEGRILELNQQGHRLLGLEEEAPLPGFFDAFAPKSQQGKCIASYLSLFKEGTTPESRLQIKCRGREILAHVEIVDSRPRQLITMIPVDQPA